MATTWDSGATTWDAGLTVWDVVINATLSLLRTFTAQAEVRALSAVAENRILPLGD